MLNRDKIYKACNQYHWCTHATNLTYDKILQMPRNGFTTREIAWSIYLVSDKDHTYEDILEKLKTISRKR